MATKTNEQRPETDYERWLRENKPDFIPEKHPVYDGAYQGGFLDEEYTDADAGIGEASFAPLRHGEIITPTVPRAPWVRISSYAGCFWVVVSCLAVAVLVIVAKQRGKAVSRRHRTIPRTEWQSSEKRRF
ncbi:hypothetical protein BJX64DRAFT_165606 [Aspergillus heterothallicus]